MLQFAFRRLAHRLIVASLLGASLSLFLIWFAVQENERDAGLGVVATSWQDETFFVVGQHLYRLDDRGGLIESYQLDTLGIRGDVSDISLGSDRLLIVEDNRVVHRCLLDGARCLPVLTLPDDRSRQVVVEIAEEEGRFYLGRLDHLQVYGLDGRLLNTIELDIALSSPGQLVWLGLGHLLVVDRAQHRVIVMRDLGDGASEIVEEYDFRKLAGLGRRSEPLSAMRDHHGQTWVLSRQSPRQPAKLMFFDRFGQPGGWVDLGAGVSPRDLALHSDFLLVSDVRNGRLLSVSLTNREVQLFGDAVLHALLGDFRAKQKRRQFIYLFGLVGLGVSTLLGFTAAWLLRRARDEAEVRRMVMGEPVGDRARRSQPRLNPEN